MNTTNNGHKIGLASAFGALIGGFAAWYLAHTVLAVLLGAASAAISAYLAYEWRKVVQAFGLAWTRIVGWKPDKSYWHNARRNLLFFFQYALMIQGVLFYIFLTESLLLDDNPLGYKILSSFAASCSALIALSFLVVLESMCGKIGISLPDSLKGRAREIGKVNIISIPFLVIALGAGLIQWTIVRVPVAFRIAWKMAKTVFFAVHCEERVQAAFYGTAGLFVGHFTTHALAGILVGAASGYLLGWGSYRVISVRLLKPRPAPTGS